MINKDIAADREFISRCFNLDNLSFLIGTGLSKQFDGPTMQDIAKKIIKELSKKDDLDDLTKQWMDKYLSIETPNTEAFLDSLYLKKRYLDESKKKDQLNETYIDITRKVIFDLCVFTPNVDKLKILFVFLNCLINRKSGLSRVQLFTINYDLLIEQCADELGILLNDGFDGTVKRWLNTSQFDLDFYYPSGIVGDKPVRCERAINYYKLHGSLNWIKDNNRIVKGQCSRENMLIYPCQIKYDMILYEPFSEIFRRFSVSIKRPKGAMVVVGYSFGDAHINQVILQALEQPHFRLIVIEPNKKNMNKNFPESSRFSDKIKQLNITFQEFVERYLPKEMDDFLSSSDKVINSFKNLIKEVKTT